MRIEVSPLDFYRLDSETIKPADPELWAKAQDYMRRELDTPFQIDRMAKTWLAYDENEVCGIMSYIMVPDFTHFRVSGPNAVRATKMMADRVMGYLADSGLRGGYLLLHVSSKERPEQRCNRWQESLKAIEAVPADRFLVRVR